jgi:TatD DNase family protein
MLIDTHCHLDFSEYDVDRDKVIQRAQEKSIEYIIDIGSNLENSRKAVALAQKYDIIFATVGCHPHDADSLNGKGLKELEELAQNAKVVAIGEIGLDYYRNLSSQANQKKVFISLIGLAKQKNLPLVIHSRQASSDTLEILKGEAANKVIVHCFSADPDFLKDCLGLGYYVSFTANITYKKAQLLREIVRSAPLERICLETDAPYLSPEGFRGKRNEPWFVQIVAEEVARIKGISSEKVAQVTTENAKSFFNLNKRGPILKHIL